MIRVYVFVIILPFVYTSTCIAQSRLFTSSFACTQCAVLKHANNHTEFAVIVQGGEGNREDLPVAVSNPAWAQQASSALAAATRERVELQRAVVEAEDSIVRSALFRFLFRVTCLTC